VQGRAANWTISEQALNIAREVSAIAQEIGASASQVAIAWLRQQRGVIIPLLGARNAEQLKDNPSPKP
jgi:aryl-alcohol dehydrogenase-like predicted oxidoreductase